MAWLIDKLLRRNKAPGLPVIVVGTEYPSYALGASIIESPGYLELRFVLNESPWAHRTFMHNAQLRYPNELLALVAHHQIRAVLCVEQADYDKLAPKFMEPLQQLKCALLLTSAQEGPKDIQQKIVAAGPAD